MSLDVADARFLTIGGIDQWVMVRGRNVDNPLLILLHGGPGASATGLHRTFNAELESNLRSSIGISAAPAARSGRAARRRR